MCIFWLENTWDKSWYLRKSTGSVSGQGNNISQVVEFSAKTNFFFWFILLHLKIGQWFSSLWFRLLKLAILTSQIFWPFLKNRSIERKTFISVINTLLPQELVNYLVLSCKNPILKALSIYVFTLVGARHCTWSCLLCGIYWRPPNSKLWKVLKVDKTSQDAILALFC